MPSASGPAAALCSIADPREGLEWPREVRQDIAADIDGMVVADHAVDSVVIVGGVIVLLSAINGMIRKKMMMRRLRPRVRVFCLHLSPLAPCPDARRTRRLAVTARPECSMRARPMRTR